MCFFIGQNSILLKKGQRKDFALLRLPFIAKSFIFCLRPFYLRPFPLRVVLVLLVARHMKLVGLEWNQF